MVKREIMQDECQESVTKNSSFLVISKTFDANLDVPESRPF